MRSLEKGLILSLLNVRLTDGVFGTQLFNPHINVEILKYKLITNVKTK